MDNLQPIEFHSAAVPVAETSAMLHEHDRHAPYKCIVATENSAAELRVGAKSFAVVVLDTSREGFTVRVPNVILNRIHSKPRCRLSYAGELWEVICESEFSDSSDFTNIGLLRARDLIKVKLPSGFRVPFGPMFSLKQDPSFLLGLLVAFLAACFCLPGVGDQVGSAPKISRAVRGAWTSFENSVFP